MKVPVNWGVQRFTNYISLIEQERLILAAYEAEQSRLEWERMNRKANAAIYNLEVYQRKSSRNEFIFFV